MRGWKQSTGDKWDDKSKIPERKEIKKHNIGEKRYN